MKRKEMNQVFVKRIEYGVENKWMKGEEGEKNK